MFETMTKFLTDIPSNYKDKPLSNGIHNIPSGAVILTRSKGSLFSYLIRKITSDWSNHAALYFGSGKHEVVESISGGVKRSILDKYINKDSQFEVWMKRDLSVMQLAVIKGYAYGCVGKRYDWKDILGFVWRPFKEKISERKMICSELVAMSYNSTGIKTTDKELSQTSPGDLRDYFQSITGKRDKWYLWDTFNC